MNRAIGRKELITGAFILGAIAVIIVYGLFDPSSAPFPRCVFLSLTGLQCPGCGSQRAIHSLLHFDIAAAWRFNALLVLSLPLLTLMAVAAGLRGRYPRFYDAVNSRHVILAVFVAVIFWWVFRNIL